MKKLPLYFSLLLFGLLSTTVSAEDIEFVEPLTLGKTLKEQHNDGLTLNYFSYEIAEGDNFPSNVQNLRIVVNDLQEDEGLLLDGGPAVIASVDWMPKGDNAEYICSNFGSKESCVVAGKLLEPTNVVYVGVKCDNGCDFDIVVEAFTTTEREEEERELFPAEWYSLLENSGKAYDQFLFDTNSADDNSSLVIHVEKVDYSGATTNLDSSGYSDLFISSDNSSPTKDNYSWKSAEQQQDSVFVLTHSHIKNLEDGLLHLSVRCDQSCVYRIKVEFMEQEELSQGYSLFDILHKGQKRMWKYSPDYSGIKSPDHLKVGFWPLKTVQYNFFVTVQGPNTAAKVNSQVTPAGAASSAIIFEQEDLCMSEDECVYYVFVDALTNHFRFYLDTQIYGEITNLLDLPLRRFDWDLVDKDHTKWFQLNTTDVISYMSEDQFSDIHIYLANHAGSMAIDATFGSRLNPSNPPTPADYTKYMSYVSKEIMLIPAEDVWRARERGDEFLYIGLTCKIDSFDRVDRCSYSMDVSYEMKSFKILTEGVMVHEYLGSSEEYVIYEFWGNSYHDTTYSLMFTPYYSAPLNFTILGCGEEHCDNKLLQQPDVQGTQIFQFDQKLDDCTNQNCKYLIVITVDRNPNSTLYTPEANFTLMIHEEETVIQLENHVQVHSWVPLGELKLYQFNNFDPEVEEITFILTPISGEASLKTVIGDIEKIKHADYSDVFTTTQTYKIDDEHTDLTGNYYIGVYGRTWSYCTLIVKASTPNDDDSSHDLVLGLPRKDMVHAYSSNYYRLQVARSSYDSFLSQVMLSVTPLYGETIVTIRAEDDCPDSEYYQMTTTTSHYLTVPNPSCMLQSSQYQIEVETKDEEYGAGYYITASFDEVITYLMESVPITLLFGAINQDTQWFMFEQIEEHSEIFVYTLKGHVTTDFYGGESKTEIDEDLRVTKGDSTILSLDQLRSNNICPPEPEPCSIFIRVAGSKWNESIFTIRYHIDMAKKPMLMGLHSLHSGVLEKSEYDYYYFVFNTKDLEENLRVHRLDQFGSSVLYMNVFGDNSIDMNQDGSGGEINFDSWPTPSSDSNDVYCLNRNQKSSVDCLIENKLVTEKCHPGQQHKCVIYVGIQGLDTYNEYSFQFAFASALMTLTANKPVGGYVSQQDYDYYSFTINGPNDSLLLSVEVGPDMGNPAVVLDKAADPQNPVERPVIGEGHWSLDTQRGEYKQLSAEELVEYFGSTQGTYIIGVYGHTDTSYTITASASEAPVIEIHNQYGVSAELEGKGDVLYFFYGYFHSRYLYEVGLYVESGDAFFVLNDYPTPENHEGDEMTDVIHHLPAKDNCTLSSENTPHNIVTLEAGRHNGPYEAVIAVISAAEGSTSFTISLHSRPETFYLTAGRPLQSFMQFNETTYHVLEGHDKVDIEVSVSVLSGRCDFYMHELDEFEQDFEDFQNYEVQLKDQQAYEYQKGDIRRKMRYVVALYAQEDGTRFTINYNFGASATSIFSGVPFSIRAEPTQHTYLLYRVSYFGVPDDEPIFLNFGNTHPDPNNEDHFQLSFKYLLSADIPAEAAITSDWIEHGEGWSSYSQHQFESIELGDHLEQNEGVYIIDITNTMHNRNLSAIVTTTSFLEQAAIITKDTFHESALMAKKNPDGSVDHQMYEIHLTGSSIIRVEAEPCHQGAIVLSAYDSDYSTRADAPTRVERSEHYERVSLITTARGWNDWFIKVQPRTNFDYSFLCDDPSTHCMMGYNIYFTIYPEDDYPSVDYIPEFGVKDSNHIQVEVKGSDIQLRWEETTKTSQKIEESYEVSYDLYALPKSSLNGTENLSTHCGLERTNSAYTVSTSAAFTSLGIEDFEYPIYINVIAHVTTQKGAVSHVSYTAREINKHDIEAARGSHKTSTKNDQQVSPGVIALVAGIIVLAGVFVGIGVCYCRKNKHAERQLSFEMSGVREIGSTNYVGDFEDEEQQYPQRGSGKRPRKSSKSKTASTNIDRQNFLSDTEQSERY